VTAIRPGVKVLARAYDGELLERVAMTEVIDGDDFPVVWVCREDEWEGAHEEHRDADGLPWPAEDVEALDREPTPA
jgi:hypothetical protein